MSFFAKNDIVDVDIPGMNKKTILWTISLIILGIATAYGTLYYLEWRDKKLREKMREESKPTETQQELTEEEKLLQRQSDELDKQKQETETLKINIDQQSEELDALRQQEADQKPLIEEQIRQQAEELDKLRDLYK